MTESKNEYKKGAIKDVVYALSEHGFRTHSTKDKRDDKDKPVWFNFAKKENRKEPFEIPSKGDMIQFHWYQKLGTKSVYVDQIKILAGSEPIDTEQVNESSSPVINDTQPPGRSVGERLHYEPELDYKPQDKKDIPKVDNFSRQPYGYYSIEDFKNSERDQALRIMFSVCQNNATSLVSGTVDAKKILTDDTYRSLLVGAVKDITMQLMLNWIDERIEIEDAYVVTNIDEAGNVT